MPRTYRLDDLAAAVGAELRGDGARTVSGVAPLDKAQPDTISFLTSPSYHAHLARTRAGAVILKPDDADLCPTAALLSDNPYAAYARIARLLYPDDRPAAGAHPSAVVGASCKLGEGVSIGPRTVIGEVCEIGADVVIGPGCVIADGVVVGPGSRLVANITLCPGVRLGARVLVQPGAVIGGDGFGFANDAGEWVRIPQVGGVVIGDDVEIGANTTIDRGALEDTVIGDGVKLDNLIMIAHNVRIGAGTAMAACVAIAGSTDIGERCTIGGKTGIVGHIKVADDVHIAGMSFITGNVDTPGSYASATPLMESRVWRRSMVRLKQLDDLARRLIELERKQR